MILHALATRLVVFDEDRVRVFDGTYQDFLDRVGWANEPPVQRSSSNETTNSTPADAESCAMSVQRNKKDMRRLRADLITYRGRVLGALKNRIAEIEGTIIALEQKVNDDTGALLEVSVKGDGPAIKSLSKSLHAKKGQIEALFDEMAVLTAELESKTKEFEQEIRQV